MTRVKVCGLTDPREAAWVADEGAAAIGLVFWPSSPRAVTSAQARAIVDALPPFVQAVGVFVDATPAQVADVADSVGLDVVQLHGDERVDDWADFAWPILKALTLPQAGRSAWHEQARALLLDAHDPERRGGTGTTIDWRDAGRRTWARPIVLAGGLTADNVARAIAEVRPSGVDVSSGVEVAPGRKDRARVRAFLDEVRRADDQHRVQTHATGDEA